MKFSFPFYFSLHVHIFKTLHRRKFVKKSYALTNTYIRINKSYKLEVQKYKGPYKIRLITSPSYHEKASSTLHPLSEKNHISSLKSVIIIITYGWFFLEKRGRGVPRYDTMLRCYATAKLLSHYEFQSLPSVSSSCVPIFFCFSVQFRNLRAFNKAVRRVYWTSNLTSSGARVTWRGDYRMKPFKTFHFLFFFSFSFYSFFRSLGGGRYPTTRKSVNECRYLFYYSIKFT